MRDLKLNYEPDNVWLHRVKDICRAAIERWQGMVQVGMTDIGGNLDVLSAFRPGEKLLLDLYDCPDDVKRVHGICTSSGGSASMTSTPSCSR